MGIATVLGSAEFLFFNRVELLCTFCTEIALEF